MHTVLVVDPLQATVRATPIGYGDDFVLIRADDVRPMSSRTTHPTGFFDCPHVDEVLTEALFFTHRATARSSRGSHPAGVMPSAPDRDNIGRSTKRSVNQELGVE